MEDRQARADRWSEGANLRIGTVEPEWWLRMVCGQLAQEASVAHYPTVRRVVLRAENQLRVRFRPRSATVGIGWLGDLSRRDLPSEPPWWAVC
jgi:hypothetical protein